MKHNSYLLTLNSRKPLAIALAVLIVVTSIFALTFKNTPRAQAAWYNASWNYRQKIIIDHNKVPNSDQTNFPVLIKITDATNPIFDKAQADGDDLLFTSSNETTKLSHEIETFSTSTHELWAWVKIPTLSHTTDTVIYLYYGNADATSQQTATDVWSNGYIGNWHMSQTSGSLLDSTSHSYSGSPGSGVTQGTVGKVGTGATLDATSNGKITASNVVINSSVIVAQAWVKGSWNGDGTRHQLMTWGAYNVANTFTVDRWDSNYLRWIVWKSDGNAILKFKDISLSSWSNTNPNLITMVLNGSGMFLYVNGSLFDSNASTGSVNSTKPLYIGYEQYGGPNAILDEVSVATTSRSADWIATEYNNQNSPETFYNISGEVGKDNYTYQSSPSGWYDAAWSKRQPISLNPTHDKVPNTSQTNFPVLVKLTDAGNNLWVTAQSDGDDILFADTSGNKLAHEIEKYDNSTHELWAWVKVPTLTTGVTTTIYMYYGNSGSANQQSAKAVWSNGYVGVWHMGETSGTIYDATSGGYTGTPAGTPLYGQTGKINKAVYFSGDDKFSISVPMSAGDYTYTWWSKTSDPNTDTFLLNGSPTSILSGFANGYFGLHTQGSFQAPGYGLIPIPDTDWHQYAFRCNGTTLYYYRDGTLINQLTVVAAGARTLTVLASAGASNYWIGTLEDMKVSSISRSADWIATEYANQNSPETFETFGTAETSDTFAPSNPSSVSGYQSLGGSAITNNAGSDSTPYYSWPEPEAVGGATDQTGAYISGVAGYYSYFGTSCGGGGADPAASRGVLSDTGSGLHYSSTTNISVPDLTTNQGSYCLRIKTKDNAGNISAVSEVATYNFDTTAPNAPTFVASNPAGYSAVNSFDFTWPAATDNVGGSGLAGYQYKRGGSSGDDWSATQVGSSKTGIASYQTGENIFLVRSVDNAGNTSDQVQTTYYYSNSVPTKPTAVTPNPAIDDTNSFSFSWTAPVHARPIVDYGYVINAVPTTGNLTWTGSSATTLAADHFATIQGNNTFYIVAKDDSGAYGVDAANYGTATFNCTTASPPIPTGVSISDSSNRAYSTYSLTIKWSAGSGQGLSFDHYLVERSTDNVTFSNLATTSSTAYIDATGLNNQTTYYYRIKAVDNADSTSAASTTVSRIPTGKYDSAPTILQGPDATAKASSATITWVTNRASTAGVRFGTARDNLSRSQIDPSEDTEHSITIPGLEGGKKYYYQVQSLDNDRDYSTESAYGAITEFETLPLPSIDQVKVSNLTLSSGDISWTTSVASNYTLSYGTTISYGKSVTNSDSLTNNHTYKLTDLNEGTTYHFKITGTDEDGNTLVSDDYVFDTLPRPKISAVSFETNIQDSQPKSYITWTTNVATTSSVDYTPTNGSASYEESQSSFVTSHKVELSHLSDNTSYSFVVYGSDQFGNKTTSDQFTFSTPFDSRPALITDISVEPSNVGLDKVDKAQLIVSWHTDEPASTQVEYGEGVTGNYTSKTSEDKALTNEHFVIISDLEPNQPYHLRVVSKDKGGNPSISEDTNTVPGEVPKSVIQTILQSFESVFGWVGRLI